MRIGPGNAGERSSWTDSPAGQRCMRAYACRACLRLIRRTWWLMRLVKLVGMLQLAFQLTIRVSHTVAAAARSAGVTSQR